MNKEEFTSLINTYFNEVKLEPSKIDKFYKYMNILLEWNEKINLTAIVEPKEIIIKHFLDSVVILKYIKDTNKVIDVGTGAGFPGVPLKIMNESLDITLVDSLNKRINFLQEVINTLTLTKVTTIHSRAEELGANKEYREKFDIVTSRAVANLSTLVEYMLPLVKIGGKCICMKGPNIKDEIKESNNAINILGGKIETIEELVLQNTDIIRNIIVIEKIANTPVEYPRKAGVPTKNPLK